MSPEKWHQIKSKEIHQTQESYTLITKSSIHYSLKHYQANQSNLKVLLRSTDSSWKVRLKFFGGSLE